VHYVAEGEALHPAAETPFARDAVFGYRSSNLREWVAEKTAGRLSAADVLSITLDDLRRGGVDAVLGKLLAAPRGTVGVVNAAGYRDLEILVLALLRAEAAGRRYLYRTAASFVRVRVGIAPRGLLTGAELDLPAGGGGGLVIVGSHVPRSTAQLQRLLSLPGIASIEVCVPGLLDPERRVGEVRRTTEAARAGLRRGQTVVIYTSRALITGPEAAGSIAVGQRISAGLVEIVRRIETQPRYGVAKGGITASDIATAGLGVKRALVIGQILPGVPVWRLGAESRYPGLNYVVFPGNVGDEGALVALVQMDWPAAGVRATCHGRVEYRIWKQFTTTCRTSDQRF